MSAFTPTSEVLLCHSDDSKQSRILFADGLQDDLPAHFESAVSRAHTQQLRHWQVFNRQMGDNARFSLVAQADNAADSDMLIYYWPKGKPEVQLQLMNILSLLPMGTDIFIIGENRSGIRSTEQILVEYALLNEVDSACCCGLYYSRLEEQPVFDAEKHWDKYQTENLTIKTPPGIFSRDGLDANSQLLLSTLTPHTKGKILGVGCGTDVLSVTLANCSPKARLALCDVGATAVEANHATLAVNGIEGDVIASNVFSDVTGRFDMIISNPPFHDSTQTSLDAAQTLIRGAVRHLNSGGGLRTVANALLSYPKVLNGVFDFHEAIAQVGRSKVYRTIMARQVKKA